MTSSAKKNDTRDDTSDYSATKAPENREHVESDASVAPNVPRRPHVQVGMEALHRETVPSKARDLNQTDED